MSDWTFIQAAYIVTWTVVCTYTLLGISKLRRAEQRLAEIESPTEVPDE
jgi:CcmD family protein